MTGKVSVDKVLQALQAQGMTPEEAQEVVAGMKGRKGDGTSRFRLYATLEQAQAIKAQFPGVRIEQGRYGKDNRKEL